jgi:hypothetical protein
VGVKKASLFFDTSLRCGGTAFVNTIHLLKVDTIESSVKYWIVVSSTVNLYHTEKKTLLVSNVYFNQPT